jgi:hypothetical protein
MASQGLETQNWKDTKSPKCDDTKSLQKENMARTQPRKWWLERGKT